MSYDIAIIGAGVIGCAIVRRLARGGARCVLLEKGADILSGASKGNSALLHTGFDAPPDSIELACVQAGYAEYLQIHEALNLPLLETGALVVAWNEAEFMRLFGIVAQAHVNGVPGVHELTRTEVYAREPNLGPGVLGAVWVPGEHVIDPWSAPLAYVLQAMACGAQVRRGCEVIEGRLEDGVWKLATTSGEIQARVVINAAGLHGDHVERIARPSPFTIKPRKGQFVVFDKPAYALVRSIVLPVPNERTKGVVLTRTAFGNLMVGPTAEEVDERDNPSVEAATLRQLLDKASALVPALAYHAVNAVYAGLRPATQFKDYQIAALPERQWITVGGIRSTGLTGSLGIAQHVARLYAAHFGGLAQSGSELCTPVPNLCEARARPWQQASAGEVVCHCERVTHAEVEAALSGPLPAGDLGGLKRRTRCGMGRCQGFYCSARVAQIAQGRLADLPAARLSCIPHPSPLPTLTLPSPASETGTFSVRERELAIGASWPSHDVVIIGAGPAGLGCAQELRRLGVRDIVVIEREQHAGGVPRHCGHTGFGWREFRRLLHGPDYARRLIAACEGIDVRTGVAAVRLDAAGVVQVATPEGHAVLQGQRVLLALGTRETPRAARLISGTRPFGVFTTGALQQMVYLAGMKPCRRAVIVGSELVSFSNLLTLRHAGARAVALMECGDRVLAPRAGAWIAPLLFGTRVLTRTRVVRVLGRERVTGVEVDRDGAREIIACDALVFSGRFVPETALLWGSPIALDPGNGAPVVDREGRCSDRAYFATGNMVPPVGASWTAWQAGRRVARAIAAELREPQPAAAERAA